jgi:hypothetical protein
MLRFFIGLRPRFDGMTPLFKKVKVCRLPLDLI